MPNAHLQVDETSRHSPTNLEPPRVRVRLPFPQLPDDLLKYVTGGAVRVVESCFSIQAALGCLSRASAQARFTLQNIGILPPRPPQSTPSICAPNTKASENLTAAEYTFQ